MTSILILLAGLILSLLAVAVVTAVLARLVGSERGRFAVGLLVAVLMTVVGLAGRAIEPLLIDAPPVIVLAAGILLLIVQLGAMFAIIKIGFRLGTKRALAPFAGYLGVAALQWGVVFFVIRPFLLESLVMPTAGMAPTLEPGTRFVVNKTVSPRRFDLVVFWHDSDPPIMYCQRLIGLPGESLRTENGELYINSEKVDVPEVLVNRITLATPRSPFAQVSYAEGETITLRPDKFFFIGDDIDASADSRMHGPTQREAIVGVVDWIYWPRAKARVLR